MKCIYSQGKTEPSGANSLRGSPRLVLRGCLIGLETEDPKIILTRKYLY
jgi:hypothetical protein